MRTATTPDKRTKRLSDRPVVHGLPSNCFYSGKPANSSRFFSARSPLRHHEFLREGLCLKERGVQACNAISFRISFRICNCESLRDSESSDFLYIPLVAT